MGLRDVVVNKFTFIFIGSLLFYVGFWRLAEVYVPPSSEIVILAVGIGLTIYGQFNFKGNEDVKLIIKSVGRIFFILGGGILLFPWIEQNYLIAVILGAVLVLFSNKFASLINGAL